MRPTATPRGWRSVRIGDVFEVVGGGTPSTGNPSYWDGPIAWVTSADIGPDLRLRPRKSITEDAVRESATTKVEPGSVVVATPVGLGKVAVTDRETCFSQDCQALLPAPAVALPKFIAHQLSVSTQAFHHSARGTTISGVTKRQLLDLEFRFPDLETQSRIVSKIEALFSDLDAGVAALERAKANLARYRAAMLKAAVEGRLTEVWRRENPNVEPADELLHRILTQRLRYGESTSQSGATTGRTGRKGKKGEDWNVADVRFDSALRPLPDKWIWSSLGHCFRVVVGATPSRRRPEYWNGSIPWVSSGEVRFCRITDTRERITIQGLANSNTRLNPARSVMLGMIGEGKTRGQAAILDIPAANNQNCAAIIVSETPIVPEYVYYWLWSQYEATRRRSAGGNQPALNRRRVETIPIPLPPVDEQQVIVKRLESEMSLIQRIEVELESAKARSAVMRQGILRRAFAGSLYDGLGANT